MLLVGTSLPRTYDRSGLAWPIHEKVEAGFGEIARVRVCDVNTDAGTVRFWGAASRTNPLDDWGCETIDQDLRERHYAPDPLSRLCVSGPLTPGRAAHSVTVGLRSVLHEAALGAEPDVAPAPSGSTPHSASHTSKGSTLQRRSSGTRRWTAPPQRFAGTPTTTPPTQGSPAAERRRMPNRRVVNRHHPAVGPIASRAPASDS